MSGHVLKSRLYWRAAQASNVSRGNCLRAPIQVRRDAEYTGRYRIAGTVDELGAVGVYRVRLFDRQSARVIRETWSAADGSYSFDWLEYRDKGYFAIAYDHGDNPVNAAIADLLTPEPMPT